MDVPLPRAASRPRISCVAARGARVSRERRGNGALAG
jgi:hypothetical protein